MPASEYHYMHRIGWLRAAVLGANDGIVSTASLIVGVAAASTGRTEVLLAGAAGLTAGALSMAAGEYVSVSSQADTENSDIARERDHLLAEPEDEFEELVGIYQDRGLSRPLAEQVATELTDSDALAAHVRDELGITDHTSAQPMVAAAASAFSFALGAGLPLVAAMLAPVPLIGPSVAALSLVFLALLGLLGARAGGAPVVRSILRVVFWGAAAMLLTAAVGWLFGVAVG